MAIGRRKADGGSEGGEGRRFCVILFTDVVGFMDTAQRLGDDAAVEILAVHDRIVRAAIGSHGGREVKHTGDGVMASFPSAPEGVQAAVDIMRAAEHHNQRDPGSGFRLRIGLNAGEPVFSQGDLFGAAVSLAARLCNAAAPSTILATEALPLLCMGKCKRFGDHGSLTIKGIEEPVTVCEVEWQAEDPTETPRPEHHRELRAVPGSIV